MDFEDITHYIIKALMITIGFGSAFFVFCNIIAFSIYLIKGFLK
jgi:hypothetical protein